MRVLTKVGVGTIGAFTLSVGLIAPAAYADSAPGPKDIVGVGSDTVQFAIDFVADGDPSGNTGFNQLGNIYRVFNFDATADANARLTYGNAGAAGPCAPGTGTGQGTGAQTTTNTATPCVQNSSVVLRAGTLPVRRPNGSGDGTLALKNSTKVNFSRASSAQGGSLGATFDSIQLGTDTLAMLTATTTNAPALSAAQLKLIYLCTATTWNATNIGGTSADTIIPVLPQAGSGTRKSFLADIGVTEAQIATNGGCTKVGEENDPTIPAQFATPQDVITPMSNPRLLMWQGQAAAVPGPGTVANGFGGFFHDPSCKFLDPTGGANCFPTPQTLSPSVTEVLTGTPSFGGALYTDNRALYVYFRDADINSSVVWQPGTTLNWVRTLFYDPCAGSGAPGTGTGPCTGPGLIYGPGGAPFLATGSGQTEVAQAGIAPTYVFTPSGP
jgi:ABC-type phosphate transport system substrate-binding protein